MKDQLLETWNIHNHINLYLLDAIEPLTGKRRMKCGNGRSLPDDHLAFISNSYFCPKKHEANPSTSQDKRHRAKRAKLFEL